MTGNLGLTALYQAVCALMEPLRARDCSALEGRYQALLAAKAALEALR